MSTLYIRRSPIYIQDIYCDGSAVGVFLPIGTKCNNIKFGIKEDDAYTFKDVHIKYMNGYGYMVVPQVDQNKHVNIKCIEFKNDAIKTERLSDTPKLNGRLITIDNPVEIINLELSLDKTLLAIDIEAQIHGINDTATRIELARFIYDLAKNILGHDNIYVYIECDSYTRSEIIRSVDRFSSLIIILRFCLDTLDNNQLGNRQLDSPSIIINGVKYETRDLWNDGFISNEAEDKIIRRFDEILSNLIGGFYKRTAISYFDGLIDILRYDDTAIWSGVIGYE